MGRFEAALAPTSVGTPAWRCLCWGSVRGLQARGRGHCGGRKDWFSLCSLYRPLSPWPETALEPYLGAEHWTQLSWPNRPSPAQAARAFSFLSNRNLYWSIHTNSWYSMHGLAGRKGRGPKSAIKILETPWCFPWLSYSNYSLSPELDNRFHSHLGALLSKVLSLARQAGLTLAALQLLPAQDQGPQVGDSRGTGAQGMVIGARAWTFKSV